MDQPATAWAPDFANPADNLAAFMKLAFSQDEREFAYFYEGPVYGVSPDGAMRLLATYHSLLRYAIEPRGENTWFVNYIDAGFYGDLETGAPLKTWTNPYNGLTVEPLSFAEGPGPAIFSPHAYIWLSSIAPAPTPQEFNRPFRLLGDSVWLEYDIYLAPPNPLAPDTWPLASSGATLPISSVVLFKGSRAAFEDPAVKCIQGTQFFDHSILPWMPWMLMGQRPGHLLFKGVGRKLASLDELPPERLAQLKAVRPTHFGPASQWDQIESETVWSHFMDVRAPI